MHHSTLGRLLETPGTLQMMETMDVDNNGEIDYMEFVAASMSAYQMSHGLTPAASKAWQKRVRIVFDKIDEDGNGYITSQELTKMMGDSEEVQQLIKDADKNGDGVIDYQEFLEILRENTRAGARPQEALAELSK
jgi:calcium-dependent protein kinase